MLKMLKMLNSRICQLHVMIACLKEKEYTNFYFIFAFYFLALRLRSVMNNTYLNSFEI